MQVLLKPCPFCGQAPKMETNAYTTSDTVYYTITCNCGAKMTHKGTQANTLMHISKLLEAWNDRVYEEVQHLES